MNLTSKQKPFHAAKKVRRQHSRQVSQDQRACRGAASEEAWVLEPCSAFAAFVAGACAVAMQHHAILGYGGRGGVSQNRGTLFGASHHQDDIIGILGVC